MGSKLEMYVDILKVLAESGPLKASHIAVEANVTINTLKGYLEFLIKQGLIEEHIVGKSNAAYIATSRGTSVINFFKELDKTLTILEEDKTLPLQYEEQELGK
ncbi:MAG TPA: winged helix-turn-helix domain-containing protein [Candidatus Acidoferrum sp.]|nr:winged helix-turn-helix domain-containing protein [Candidatus Acidoferrum sp.]